MIANRNLNGVVLVSMLLLLCITVNALAAVEVVSYPSGAELSLDNEFVGVTPVRLFERDSGEHNMRLNRTGFAQLERVIVIPESGIREITVWMTVSEPILLQSPVAVLVYEEVREEQIPEEDPAAETELSRQLLRIGLRIAEREALSVGAKTEIRQAVEAGDMQTVYRLLEEDKIRYLVLGQAQSELIGETPGDISLRSARALLEIKVIDVQQHLTIGSNSFSASGADASAFLASKKALSNAALIAGPYVIDIFAEVAGGRR